MKRQLFIIAAAIILSACATVTAEEADVETSVVPEGVCAIENPDGTCACKAVDDNGECVEGGGVGVIIPRSGDS